MSKKRMTAKEEETDVLMRARYIVSKEETVMNSSDKSYINCIKYIFTKEFTEPTLSLPIDRSEKDSFQYLKCFVKIFDILFSKDETERCKLYHSEVSPKLLGNDLFNLMQNLEKLAEKKGLGKFNLNNPNDIIKLADLKESVNFIFCNYVKNMGNKLYSFLNLHFYYLGFFIQSINTFKLSLYYLLQDNDKFKHLGYKEFCPDLQKSNCLNLIKLFFKSIVKESIEMLTIYSLLIFKYEYIFQDIDYDIGEEILEIAAKKTLVVVQEKTLNNDIIFEYIFLEFINNLNTYINKGNLIRIQKEKSKIIEQKNEGKRIEVPNKDNIKEEVKDIKNEIIDNNKNEHGINEESFNNKKAFKYESAQPENFNKEEEDTSNNINYNNEKKSNEKLNKIEENIHSNGKETDYINPENINNNSESGTKETSKSYQSLSSNNGSSNLEPSEIIGEGQLKNLINFESEFVKSEDMKKIIEAIYKMRAEDDERFKKKIEKIEKENRDKFENIEKEKNELQNKITLIETQLKKVEDKNNEMTEILGHIQLRDKAKNFLRSFNIILDENDLKPKDEKTKEKKEKQKKWILIAQKIKKEYEIYKNSSNYKVFCEIIDKSAQTIEKGNQSAHKIKLEYYEKNISKFNNINKIAIMNPFKMCFLLQINVSEDCLLNGYDFLNSYYENDLTRAFTRSKPLKEFFD